ncbi:MAG: dihydropteroate synthase [Aphanocapsa lilacina HA4352-LM1]|jgi:dihydropteroate synthase|nr:dihydropteroate synthase [Aphanocapsa lilacina HA4352-LM1]
MTQIVGIVNITTDSFSDGGQFLDAERAIGHARRLRGEGAHWIDLGAESSNPDGEQVTAEIEAERLAPVVAALSADGVSVAIDTCKSSVMVRCLELGAQMINDITALADPRSVEVLKTFRVPVVLMFARNRQARAEQRPGDCETVWNEIEAFFSGRIDRLLGAGLQDRQLILDPGMGFFLGSNPEPSLRVLAHVDRLGRFGLPVYLSVSRKSFIGSVLGGRPAAGRDHGTLAAEIWAYLAGVDYLRTHAVAPLSDAIRVIAAIRAQELA